MLRYFGITTESRALRSVNPEIAGSRPRRVRHFSRDDAELSGGHIVRYTVYNLRSIDCTPADHRDFFRMARILVIDDDRNIQTVLHDILSHFGHDVQVAVDGLEGLARYRDCHPDLVITDIFMPERNGLDVILDLAPNNANIIAMSGGGDLDRGDYLDDAIQFGARCGLRKPFTVNALIEAVNKLIA